MRESLQASTRSGFTLIEVVIAALMMTILVTGTMGLHLWVMQATAYSQRYSTAAALAQAQMEQLIEDGFENATSGSDVQGLYQRVWQVSDLTLPGAGTSTERILAVTVIWPDTRGRTRRMRLQSLVSADTMKAGNLQQILGGT